ncbi:50S ribosomal protein L29 [Woeseiaceae bacterium]|jgi:large subunit ribosomal protein L29|nr:50S ribosomal protein L29 [Woeseiaceae bacterium]
MKASDLRSKSRAELIEELLSLRKEQFNLRMQQATGQMSRPHEHKLVRKNISRVKTIIRDIERSELNQVNESK